MGANAYEGTLPSRVVMVALLSVMPSFSPLFIILSCASASSLPFSPQWVCISTVTTDFTVNDLCWSLLHAASAHEHSPLSPFATIESTCVVAVGDRLATFKFVSDDNTGVAIPSRSSISSVVSIKGGKGTPAPPPLPVSVSSSLCSARLVLEYSVRVPVGCGGPLSFVTVSPDCRCIATGGPGFSGALVWYKDQGSDGFTYTHIVVDDGAETIQPDEHTLDSEELLSFGLPMAHTPRGDGPLPPTRPVIRMLSLEWRPLTLEPRSACCGASCSRRKGVTVTTLNVLMGVWTDGQVRVWRESDVFEDMAFTLCGTWAVAGEDAKVADGSDLTHSRGNVDPDVGDVKHISASWVGYGLLKDRLRGSWCTDHLLAHQQYRDHKNRVSVSEEVSASDPSSRSSPAPPPPAVLGLWPRHGHLNTQGVCGGGGCVCG